jgi:hypothetical protein
LKTNKRHLLYNLALIACLIAKQLGSIIDLALNDGSCIDFSHHFLLKNVKIKKLT